jgi:uncharacterized membrane protein
VVSPRKEEVAAIYEGIDEGRRLALLNKYNVHYIVVGQLERQKFQKLNEKAIQTLGKEVFRSNNTVIYEKQRAY